jgi:hypothetical protein
MASDDLADFFLRGTARIDRSERRKDQDLFGRDPFSPVTRLRSGTSVTG